MNKLFLAICFSILAFNANAATVEIKDIGAAQQNVSMTDAAALTPDGMPDPENTDEVIAFFKDRFKMPQ